MQNFIGILGVILILGVAYAFSNNKKAINFRTVGVGIALQFLLALFILKTSLGKAIFGTLGAWVTTIIDFANVGGEFVFGPLANSEMVQNAFGGG
jgi:CNT family concentrative nucleoside transporter